MLIGISLGVLIVITLFAIITGSSIKEIGSEGLEGTALINGSSQTYDISDISQTFYIDEFSGALVIIIFIVMISVLIGIRIFNTGLSDTSIRIASICITYYGIWILFSVLSYELIISIEVIGVVLYITLTIVFTIGIIQKIEQN